MILFQKNVFLWIVQGSNVSFCHYNFILRRHSKSQSSINYFGYVFLRCEQHFFSPNLKKGPSIGGGGKALFYWEGFLGHLSGEEQKSCHTNFLVGQCSRYRYFWAKINLSAKRDQGGMGLSPLFLLSYFSCVFPY